MQAVYPHTKVAAFKIKPFIPIDKVNTTSRSICMDDDGDYGDDGDGVYGSLRGSGSL